MDAVSFGPRNMATEDIGFLDEIYSLIHDVELLLVLDVKLRHDGFYEFNECTWCS